MPITNSLRSQEDQHDESEALAPIAIVGVAGRFPGTHGLEDFWARILDGGDCIARLEDEQLRAAGVTAEELADPRYVKAAPLLPGVADFDAEFFGMTPREAALCDPQHRLFLETAHAAIENSGYVPRDLPGAVGVFAASGASRYAELHVRPDPEVMRAAGESQVRIGSHSDYVATAASYRLDLHGPSMTVATACSGSLVAVHLACQSLRVGECDAALAGGVNVELPYGHGYRHVTDGVLSADGRCRPFDADADGTVFGSGVGVVVLKRLDDAVAARDHVLAVIRGTAMNNDGAGKVSFGAPSVEGQVGVVMEALALSGVTPRDIDFVEAHGTGTALGDPVEVKALTEAYSRLAGDDPAPGTIGIGSVKSNIGHLGAASGIAGLVKMALALDRGVMPPSIHCATPNPLLELEKTPFYVVRTPRNWPRTADRPRRAGVTSLGVGGTNVHLVLEEAPDLTATPQDETDEPRVLIWSGRSAAAEREGSTRLAEHLGREPGRFADLAATLQRGRQGHPFRGAVVASDAAEARMTLSGQSRSLIRREKPDQPPTAVFLFPGQGSQHAGMAAGLHGRDKTFTHSFDEILDLFGGLGLDVRTAWAGGDADSLADTRLAQALLFATEVSLARMWKTYGITPTAVLGHSVGELAAAVVAGVLGTVDGARLTFERGAAMSTAPKGGMLAVPAAPEELPPLPPGATVALVNGPRQTVLSASDGDVDRAAEALRSASLSFTRLTTSHAFHSPAMAAASQVFARACAEIPFRAPTLPFHSASLGRRATDEEVMSPAFWARQLIQPVRFDLAFDELIADGEYVAVEVGPGRALTSALREHPAVGSQRCLVVPTLPRAGKAPADDQREVLTAASHLWTLGHDIDWAAVDQNRPWRRRPSPGYAYQRERHWIGSLPASRNSTSAQDPETGQQARTATVRTENAPSADTAAVSAFTVPAWVERHRPSLSARRSGGLALVLLPDEDEGALPVVLALQRGGHRVIRVRHGADSAHRATADFTVPALEPEAIGSILDKLAADGEYPQLLVHALATGSLPQPGADTARAGLDLTFFTLQALVQQGMRNRGSSARPDLLVVTSQAVDVSGGEEVHPYAALLTGQMRSLAQEFPEGTCRLVDVAGTRYERELAAELLTEPTAEVVALRGLRRWVSAERPITVEPTDSALDDTNSLRSGGTYLITGGLGGLGLKVAEGMAETGLRPRLVLLSRTGAPDHPDENPRAERIQRSLARLAASGATVRLLRCDITSPRDVRRALDITEARFGPVRGVVHCAGVAGGGLSLTRLPEQSMEVLAPKVLGTLVLEEELRGRPALDFFVSFSSRAALDGLLGSADYAAANAFLDAHSAGGGTVQGRTLSINWPSWAEVGMAAGYFPGAEDGPATPSELVWETALDPQESWVVDEHRLDGVPVLPATGHLDITVRAARRLLDSADQDLVLSHVTLERALAVPEPMAVRVSLRAEDEAWHFTVEARPRHGVDPWIRHAGGILRLEAATSRTVRLDRLRASFADAEHVVPEENTHQLFSLGPRWGCLDALRIDGEQRLVDLRLAPAFRQDLAGYPLHPALLDVAVGFLRDMRTEPFHLPMLYEQVRVRAALPAQAVSHVRRYSVNDRTMTGDIDVIAPDGNVVVEARGFVLRRVDDRATLGANLVTPQQTPPESGPRDQRSCAGTAPQVPDLSRSFTTGSQGQTGIPPRQGVQLFLDLLRAMPTSQVAVRPHRDGAPLPVREALDSTPADARARPAVPAPSERFPDPVRTRPVPSVDAPPLVPSPPLDDDLPAVLRALWCEALGVSAVDDTDDFFDLGGHSLSAVQLMARLRDDLGVDLSIAVLFDHPTLTGLAQHIQERKGR